MIIKICGITRLQDAEAAVRHGATAVGFNFWPKSPRAVDVARARAIAQRLPSHIAKVGVFVDAQVEDLQRVAEEVGLSVAQLHGHETPAYAASLACPVWKAMDVSQCATTREWSTDVPVLLDAIDPVARGGTGVQVDWTRAAGCARTRQVVLAGGLTAENVEAAIDAVRPLGVDVSSGVEQAPGVKDEVKVARFIQAALRRFNALRAMQERGGTTA